MRLWKAENSDTKRGTTSRGSARDRRASDTLALVPRDRRGYIPPVATAFAARDVVPARRTPDGVSDTERHDSPAMRPAITSASVFDVEVPLTTRPGVFVAEPRRDLAPLWRKPVRSRRYPILRILEHN